LRAVLAGEPGNVDAIGALARLEADPGALLRLLQQARAADPQAVPVRLLLARELLAIGDTGGALAAVQEANAMAADSAETLDALGTAQGAAGRKSEAVATFVKLVRVSGGSAASAQAHYRLAGAYAAAEISSRAEDEYRLVIGLQPDHAGAMLDLAQVHAARGEFVAATKLAELLQARQPRSGSGQELLGDLLARQQRYTEAAAAYDAAFAIAARGVLVVKQHGAARQAGGGGVEAGSLQRLQQWLAGHPDDAPTRQYLADQQLAVGATAAAIKNYELVLAAGPRNAFALNNLANALSAQGDPRALRTAEAAYQLQPDQPQIAHTLGWLLVQGSGLPRGLRLIQRAAADRPDAPDIGLHLAVAMAKSGDKAGARAVVKRRLDLGQDIQLDPSTRAMLQDK
jgi:putative PEP-CTERM system TPR-repeat lipoprotein